MTSRLWWQLAWRNLGRNRRRSLITAAGLAVGYFSVVAMVGWFDGLTADMITNGTAIMTGQIQVHAARYLPDRSVYETMGGSDSTVITRLLERVEADPAVSAAAPRVYGGGLVSSGEATAAGVFLGVDPLRERRVSRLLQAVVRGAAPAPGTRQILIGAEMARILRVEPGAEVVVVAPAADGSLGNELFTVSGVFESGLLDLDRTFALMPIQVLQSIMVLEPGQIHEIAAALVDPWQAPAVAGRLRATLAGVDGPVAVAPWTELRPELLEYAQLSSTWQWILLVIVFGMAIFGVANTMLMATYERRREFALLLALGTSPRGIVRSVLFEAVALGAMGLVVGAGVTLPVLVWWHLAPPDLTPLFGTTTMLGVLFRVTLRVEYPWSMMGQAAVALFLTAALAALYPALRAARVPPADTLAGR